MKYITTKTWMWYCLPFMHCHIDGLMQERRNSIANALELHLSCTNLSICSVSCQVYSFVNCVKIVSSVCGVGVRVWVGALLFRSCWVRFRTIDKTSMLIFIHFYTEIDIGMEKLKSLLMEGVNTFIVHCQYYGRCVTRVWTARVLTHWGRDKMAAIFQTKFWNAFSWMTLYINFV